MYKIGTDPTKVWRQLSPLQRAVVGGSALALTLAACSSAGANTSGNSAPATYGTTGSATPGVETSASSTPTAVSPSPNAPVAPWLIGVQWPGGRAQLPNNTCGSWSPETPQPVVSRTANVMIVTEDARWNAPINCDAQADEGGAIYQNPRTANAGDSTTAVKSFDIAGEGLHKPQFVLDGQTLEIVDCVTDGTDWSDASGHHSRVWDQVEGEPNGGTNGSSVGWESITNLGFDTLPKCQTADMATPQVGGVQQ